MSLKVVTLGLAERRIIASLLATRTDGQLATARVVRSIRQDLKLRESDRDVEELTQAVNETIKEQRAEEAAFDADQKARAEQAKKDGAVYTPKQYVPPKLIHMPDWDDLMAEPQREYTIDETHLRSLQDWLGSKNWGKVKREGKEQDVPVDPGMLEAVANTADAIADALSRKEPEVRDAR